MSTAARPRPSVRPHRPVRPCCEPLEGRTLFAAGDLDPSFGLGGVTNLRFSLGPVSDARVSLRELAVQQDGKVVAAGLVDSQPAVVRLTAGGGIDTSFGNGGLVVLRSIGGTPATWTEIGGVEVMADGRIVVAGEGYNPHAGDPVFAVGRLLPNGSLDPAFNEGWGAVWTLAGGQPRFRHVRANDVALQADNKIVVAGYARMDQFGDDYDFAVLRYNADGSLDRAFGEFGVRFMDFESVDTATAVTIDYNGNFQSNPYWGTIVVAGSKGGPFSLEETGDDFAVGRLTPNGHPDNGFDGNGKLITRIPGGNSVVSGVVTQPGGKIVAVGTKRTYSDPTAMNFALARYLPNGALDPTFGAAGTGFVETDFDGGSDSASGVVVGHLGGLIVAGRSNGHTAMAAYSRDGRLDTRFAGDGLWRPSPDPLGDPTFVALAAAPGRRLVIAGGRRVARLVDVGSVVSIGSFDPNASEPGTNVATVIVARTERLPYGERIYLNVGGTATRPGNVRLRPPDYTGTGITFGPELSAEPTYVDIPAGQTFAVATITPRDDTTAEGDETVVLSIAPSAFYDVGTPASTTLVIADNEAPPAPRVVGRHVFYDGSAFDGGAAGDPAAAANDGAIAPDKQAVLPGGAASFANVTSYHKGINGVVVDVSNLPDNGAAVTAAAFGFRAGDGGDPFNWPPSTLAPAVAVRPNAGAAGADRVVLTFPAGAVRNTWLRVTVRATAATGLAQDDTFYFGNLVGEAGDTLGGHLAVTPIDLVRTRAAVFSASPREGRHDFDRDGRVGAVDYAIARAARGRALAPFNALPPPAVLPPPAAVPARDGERDEEQALLP